MRERSAGAVDASPGEALASSDGPTDAEVHDRVRRAVDQARVAAAWWSRRTFAERAAVLRQFRAALVDHLEELCDVAFRETGKPRFDLVSEVFQTCQVIEYAVRRARRVLRPRRARAFPLIGCQPRVHYVPLGVIGIITPSNYPIVLAACGVIQALAGGNAVILKPSERTWRTAEWLQRFFALSGLEQPIWQLLEGGPEAAVALAAGGVDKVAFTGGASGGRAVARAAADSLTPVILELGGNDALLVAADADVDRAARAAVWGGFLNAGQSCIAIERCYVERPVFSEFLARLVGHAQRLVVAPSLASHGHSYPKPDVDHDVGPLLTDQLVEKVRVLVADALEKGAKVALGGPPPTAAGRTFPPTILTNVDHRMRIMQEEIFGPVLAVMEVEDLGEAIRLANDSKLGLGASIWSADVGRARRLARELDVGGVVINDCLIQFAIPDLPFGGMKQSGYGRLGGPEGLKEFCAAKTITVNRLARFGGVHWFPYGRKHRWLAAVLRLAFGNARQRFLQLKLLFRTLFHK